MLRTKMRKSYTTKLINRPEMKFYLVIDYTLPSTWLKSTQNDGGRLGLIISLKTRSRLSHLIKRESLMFSLRQYCLDFLIFTMIDSIFHFSPTFTSNLFFWTKSLESWIWIWIIDKGEKICCCALLTSFYFKN